MTTKHISDARLIDVSQMQKVQPFDSGQPTTRPMPSSDPSLAAIRPDGTHLYLYLPSWLVTQLASYVAS